MLYHIGNFIGIGNHHLHGLLFPKILEFLEHFGSGTHIKRSLLVRVCKPLHDDLPEVGILRIFKVHVTGSHHHFIQFFANADNGTVKLPQALFIGGTITDHKHIVPNRLNFQIIVKFRNFA